MIWLYIYIGCILLLLLVYLIARKPNNFTAIEKSVILVFAPIFTVFGIIDVLFIIPYQQLKEKGIIHMFSKRKGKPYPLDKTDFKFYPKDIVLDGEKDKVSIDEFNKKYGTSYTLDDIYGQGYTASLSPEDIQECKSFFANRYSVQHNLPEYEYTKVAIAFAKAFISSDFSEPASFFDNAPFLILYKKLIILGRVEIVHYFTQWIEASKKDGLEYQYIVQWCANQCRPGLYVQSRDHMPFVLLFHMENGKIKDILLSPTNIQSWGISFHDLNTPPFSVEYLGGYISDDSESLENHFFCPTCGTDSLLLDWYNFEMPLGIHGYSGKFSLCPECRRIVEFLPDVRLRYEEPRSVAFPHQIPEMTPSFVPRLKGTLTFETNDEQMDFYSDEELAKVKAFNLEAYKMFDDLEKGNDAAIICANGSEQDFAISLFTELSEKGCHNSMANLFTVLWSNVEDHKKATDWLKYVEKFDDPSLYCLWNLAVMYFTGEDLEQNFLDRDLNRANEILHRIISSQKHPLYKEDTVFFANAKKFLNAFDLTNPYSIKGEEIHKIIQNSIVLTENLKNKGELFNYAKGLTLADGYSLGLHVASEKTHDIGDESRFFIYDGNGKEYPLHKSRLDLDEVDCKFLHVAQTAMGAWELYLLMTSPTIMPVFWHGGYICRKFIFSYQDTKKIKPITDYDFSILDKDGILLPSVILLPDKTSSEVYCCYWNDWEGLVREHAHVNFKYDGTASIKTVDKFTIFEYDCGVCF